MTITEGSTVDKNAHIPTAEIERDIADTEHEIQQLKVSAEAHKALSDNDLGAGQRRMHDMRYRAALSGIQAREAFVVKLNAIIAQRNAAVLS